MKSDSASLPSLGSTPEGLSNNVFHNIGPKSYYGNCAVDFRWGGAHYASREKCSMMSQNTIMLVVKTAHYGDCPTAPSLDDEPADSVLVCLRYTLKHSILSARRELQASWN